MNTTELKLQMAQQGWNCEDRLSAFGWGKHRGYTVWFERWDWHGRTIDRATYMASAAPSEQGTPSAEQIHKAVEKAMSLALRAWSQYTEPGCAPIVLANGELALDPFRVEMVRRYPAPDEAKLAKQVYQETYVCEVVTHLADHVICYLPEREYNPIQAVFAIEKPPVGALIQIRPNRNGVFEIASKESCQTA